MFYENYIRFRDEPILGIFISSKISIYLIKKIRKHFLLNNSQKIYIISIINENQNLIYNNATIKYPSLNIGLTDHLNKLIRMYNY